ncbi:RNA-directed DNA polymerase, eukaryota, Reverse transcriptase zinc-binding domain protein [Artemisia annua]|uniref:RNA-directed DNA polymerase, eukaryota, Reverse transcriptase zinc-binding domain protein n=1 Tax=Artemisia annua TaxID=35608 RepID=A0A2U1NW98_ARTAN|nr:RNA-directed DNA polymerase, eukaryota, Reverse transcriptase zinc-binding domain protein [Artemisia annua]
MGRLLEGKERGVKFADYVDVLPTDQNMENITSNVEVLGNEKNTMDDSSQVSSGERHENVNLVAGPNYSNQHGNATGASAIGSDTGLQFTWNQKPRGTDGKLKKIDRIMANLACTDGFVGAHAIFQPYRISDHSPAILTIPTSYKFTPRPFKFYNILVQNSQFKRTVKESWDMDVSGFHMYKVVSKLKALKKPLRKLLYNKGNIHDKVVKLRHELDTVQRALDADTFNIDIREEEASYLNAYNDALLVEEQFLKQKAKVEWLRVGDSNSAYFHKVVKSRKARSRIDVITNYDGVRFEGEDVPNAFVSYYVNLQC